MVVIVLLVVYVPYSFFLSLPHVVTFGKVFHLHDTDFWFDFQSVWKWLKHSSCLSSTSNTVDLITLTGLVLNFTETPDSGQSSCLSSTSSTFTRVLLKSKENVNIDRDSYEEDNETEEDVVGMSHDLDLVNLFKNETSVDSHTVNTNRNALVRLKPIDLRIDSLATDVDVYSSTLDLVNLIRSDSPTTKVNHSTWVDSSTIVSDDNDNNAKKMEEGFEADDSGNHDESQEQYDTIEFWKSAVDDN